jgi:hypothetical protein
LCLPSILVPQLVNWTILVPQLANPKHFWSNTTKFAKIQLNRTVFVHAGNFAEKPCIATTVAFCENLLPRVAKQSSPNPSPSRVRTLTTRRRRQAYSRRRRALRRRPVAASACCTGLGLGALSLRQRVSRRWRALLAALCALPAAAAARWRSRERAH